LSHYFKRNRAEYYDRLQATRERGDWEGWLKFFLRGVSEVADEAAATARRIVTLREEHRNLVTSRMKRGAARALKLLESFYFRPIVSVHSIATDTGLSYANANTLVKQFVEIGLLKETTGQKRNRRFAYEPYLALFADSEVEAPTAQ
jgi:Fic family protein